MKLKRGGLALKRVAPVQAPTSLCSRVAYGIRIQSSQIIFLSLDRPYLLLLGKIRKAGEPHSITLDSLVLQAGGLLPSALQRFEGHGFIGSTEQSGGATEECRAREKLEELQKGTGGY